MKICPTCRTEYPDDANFCPLESCATADGPARLAPKDGAGGRFERGARLGGGVTGEVFRARDAQDGGEVAYKVFNERALSGAPAVSRAEREFKQLARVQSPGIARVIDVTKDGDKLAVAMELVAGQTLAELLAAGPVDFARAKSLVSQIGAALLDAQKAGVVHRDLATKNILLTEAGEPKLINFPVAAPVSDKAAGVPEYMSPEQAQGKPVDQRSNTYSLAAIFYHLVTGAPPFEAASPDAVLDAHVNNPPLPPTQRRPDAGLHADVDKVLLKAMDKSSSRRHLTLRLFLTEIEALPAPKPAGEAPTSAKAGAAFAKTLMFAGGQADIAKMVEAAKAAARAKQSGTAAPEAADGSENLATAGTVAIAAASPTAADGAAAAPAGVAARLTPPPVTPLPAGVAPVEAPAPAAKVAPPEPAAEASPPAAAKGAAPAGKGAAFRETLWFKKGDVDQMVAEAKAKLAASGKGVAPGAKVEVGEDVRPLEDRYVDDGSVTIEDRKKFSLRTGGTATSMPASGRVTGEGMSEQEMMREMGGDRRNKVFIVVGVVVVALIIVVVLALRGGKSDAGKHGAAPAATASPTTAAAAVVPPAPAVGTGLEGAAVPPPAAAPAAPVKKKLRRA